MIPCFPVAGKTTPFFPVAGEATQDLAGQGQAGHADGGDGVRDEPLGQPELRPGQPLHHPPLPPREGHGELEVGQVQIQGKAF